MCCVYSDITYFNNNVRVDHVKSKLYKRKGCGFTEPVPEESADPSADADDGPKIEELDENEEEGDDENGDAGVYVDCHS